MNPLMNIETLRVSPNSGTELKIKKTDATKAPVPTKIDFNRILMAWQQKVTTKL